MVQFDLPVPPRPWRFTRVMVMVVLGGTLHTAIGSISHSTSNDRRTNDSAWRMTAILVVGRIRVTVTAVDRYQQPVLIIQNERLHFIIKSHSQW